MLRQNHLRQCITAGLLLCLGSACSWFGDKDQVVARGPAIGEIVGKLPELELPKHRAPAPNREEVLAAYEKVYGSLADVTENAAIVKPWLLGGVCVLFKT